jgi:RND family efflux transporter MFP subunit
METNSATPESSVGWWDRIRPVAGWLIAILAVVCVSSGVVIARTDKVNRERSQLAQAAAAGLRVLVERAQTAPSARAISLPATIVGYSEAPMYAKIAGYLKSISVDKGDRVRKGQVLAILVSPELDEQTAVAKHNLWLQRVTDHRNQGLVRTRAISQQVADNSRGALLQAAATYRQLLAMQSYEIIKAPFDGIVTARYVDPGALIAQTITPSETTELSHTNTTATPILTLATMRPLRVYANAPQLVANSIRDGDPATVTVEQYPGRAFTGRVGRRSQALDPATRLMLVEVDLTNSDEALAPGMFGMMSLSVKQPGSAPLVPDDALVFRDNKVYVPVIQGSIVHLAPVTLGYDNGNSTEATGISTDDVIAINLGESATDGEHVQPFFQGKTP